MSTALLHRVPSALRAAPWLALLCWLSLSALADSVGYQYDSAGRLRQANYSACSISSYSLDAAGNRKHLQTLPSGGPGTLQFASQTYTVNENGGSLNVAVVRLCGTAGAVSASYAVVGGTAVQGTDYGISGTLFWAAGDSGSKNLTISIVDEGLTQGSETIQLVLQSPTGNATIGVNNFTTIKILDNDPPPPDTTPPSVPTNLLGSATSLPQVNLSWNVSTDSGGSGLAGYRVYRDGTQIVTTTSPSYPDTGVTWGASYSYTVSAYDQANNVSAQSSATVVSTPASNPSVPTNLRHTPAGTAFGGTFDVLWDPSSGAPVAYYNLQEYDGDTGAFLATYTPATPGQHFTKGNIERNFRYQVQACMSNGTCSAYSSPMNVAVCRTAGCT